MSTHELPHSGEAVPLAPLSDSELSCHVDHVSIVKDCPQEQSKSDLLNEEEEEPNSNWVKALFGKRTGPPSDLDAIATRLSVFDDPHLASFYWLKKDYENIHRLDPLARWTRREEWVLLRKADWRLMIMAVVMYSAVSLDRNNISQANSANFLSDLNLTTNDFNLGNTISRLAVLFTVLPFQLISKRVGPDRWVPTQICLCSVVSLSQFWLTGRASFLITRALLGFLQGGFVAELVLYLYYFYTKTELPVRLAWFWVSENVFTVIASFSAYGILHLDGVAGKAGWRWLFLIEGLVTFGIGVTAFFSMPPSPTQTKTWFRPNGWFTEREETITVNKTQTIRAKDKQGDMHNRENLSMGRLWTGICDYDLWPVYIIGLLFGVPASPPHTYLTLLLRNAGFNTFNTNLLVVPSEVMASISVVLITLVSELVNERAIVAMVGDLLVLPFLVAAHALRSSANPWLFYGLLTALLSHPHAQAIQFGWCSRNSGAVASRTANAALYNMFVQASAIISAQIYVASDAPRYERGNRILIIICSINVFLLYPGTKLYYIWRNHQRGKIWDAVTPEEKAHYLNTTKDVGNERLDFRFAH